MNAAEWLEKSWLYLKGDGIAVALFFLSVLGGFVLGRLGKLFFNAARGRLRDERRLIFRTILKCAAATSVKFFALSGIAGGLFILARAGMVPDLSQTCGAVLFTIAVTYTAYRFVAVPDRWLQRRSGITRSKLDDMLIPAMRRSLRVTVMVLGIVQIATLLSGKSMSSLLAGLGIGGLAFALAAQDTLKNFFGSLVLLADRPFELGDRIVVDDYDGTIEEVGFRSTRIRTLDGHLVTIPNGIMVNENIRNVSARPNIRRIMRIGITYDTPIPKIRRAKEIIEDLLTDHEGMDPELPPKVYLSEFRDSALEIFVVFWYSPPEYWNYMAFSEKLHLEILKRFNRAGIEFAFPSQTVYLEKGEDFDGPPKT